MRLICLAGPISLEGYKMSQHRESMLCPRRMSFSWKKSIKSVVQFTLDLHYKMSRIPCVACFNLKKQDCLNIRNLGNALIQAESLIQKVISYWCICHLEPQWPWDGKLPILNLGLLFPVSELAWDSLVHYLCPFPVQLLQDSAVLPVPEARGVLVIFSSLIIQSWSSSQNLVQG